MRVIDLPTTYAHHLSKPENLKVLDAYAKDKDKDVNKFIELFLWLIKTLRPTSAWDKPGTNQRIHVIKSQLEATINQAKNNKSSSFAVSGKLISTINHCKFMRLKDCHEAPEDPGVPADLNDFEVKLEAILATKNH